MRIDYYNKCLQFQHSGDGGRKLVTLQSSRATRLAGMVVIEKKEKKREEKARSLMPVISAPRRLRQENYLEFVASLRYIGLQIQVFILDNWPSLTRDYTGRWKDAIQFQ